MSPPGLSVTLWGRPCWHDHPHSAHKETSSDILTSDLTQGQTARMQRTLGAILSLLNVSVVFLLRWNDMKISSVTTRCGWHGCFHRECSWTCVNTFTFFHRVQCPTYSSDIAHGADVRLGLEGLTAPLNTSEQAKKVSSTTQKTKKISAYSNPVLKVLSFLSHFDLEFLFCLLMLCFNFEFHYIKYSFL